MGTVVRQIDVVLAAYKLHTKRVERIVLAERSTTGGTNRDCTTGREVARHAPHDDS